MKKKPLILLLILPITFGTLLASMPFWLPEVLDVYFVEKHDPPIEPYKPKPIDLDREYSVDEISAMPLVIFYKIQFLRVQSLYLDRQGKCQGCLEYFDE